MAMSEQFSRVLTIIIIWLLSRYGKIIADIINKKEIKLKKYWMEILGLLIIKAVLLTGIWYVSFSDPIVLDDKTAGEHIFH